MSINLLNVDTNGRTMGMIYLNNDELVNVIPNNGKRQIHPYKLKIDHKTFDTYQENSGFKRLSRIPDGTEEVIDVNGDKIGIIFGRTDLPSLLPTTRSQTRTP
jgi:hypothetical protein